MENLQDLGIGSKFLAFTPEAQSSCGNGLELKGFSYVSEWKGFSNVSERKEINHVSERKEINQSCFRIKKL